MKVKELASCGIGACPTVFEDGKGDLIIVGTLLTPEEKTAIAHKISMGEETAIRVPRSLIAGLKL